MPETPNVPGVPVTPVSTAVTPEPRGLLSTEPVKVATNAAQVALVLISGAAIFGLDLSEDQKQSIYVIAPTLLILIGLLGNWLRAAVTPVERAQNLIDLAYITPPEAGGANKPALPTS